MKVNVFVGKFIDRSFYVLKRVSLRTPWRFIDSPLGCVFLQLRTTVPFGHLLALIQHQFQRVFLCHFPNYENPEIGDQIHVATL